MIGVYRRLTQNSIVFMNCHIFTNFVNTIAKYKKNAGESLTVAQ